MHVWKHSACISAVTVWQAKTQPEREDQVSGHGIGQNILESWGAAQGHCSAVSLVLFFWWGCRCFFVLFLFCFKLQKRRSGTYDQIQGHNCVCGQGQQVEDGQALITRLFKLVTMNKHNSANVFVGRVLWEDGDAW